MDCNICSRSNLESEEREAARVLLWTWSNELQNEKLAESVYSEIDANHKQQVYLSGLVPP